jgi:anti-anti-sigma factor
MNDDALERDDDLAEDEDEAQRFRVEDGVLHCPEDMNSVTPRHLRHWCDKLLKSGTGKLTVDLTHTRYMASHHLGVLSEAWSRALASGRDLVIRTSTELGRIFRLSGFDQVFNVIEADG